MHILGTKKFDRNDVVRVACRDVERDFLKQAVSLWKEVWPGDGGSSFDEILANYWSRFVDQDTESSRTGVLHAIQAEGAVLAIARTFERRITFLETGEEALALCLASVCSSPSFRKRGLGHLVVCDAFLRMSEDSRFDFGLFQTSVPGFYEKLGGSVVANRFIDSTSTADPDGRPWWDPYVMAHPGNGSWQKGLVDLRGDAY